MPAHHHRCSIFCIVPPHILRNAAQNAKDEETRRAALDTLSRDVTFRSMRMLRAARGLPALAAAGVPGGTASITLYDDKQTERLPGSPIADPAQRGDAAEKEAYAGLLATYDFYWSVFERNSIDDHGLPLLATVHFGKGYDNAYWNGERMVFGDGDGKLFNRFTISVDVIGHELTHGVTGSEVNLQYLGQPGALNEHVSDVFGSLIKQKVKNQTADQADWLIGQGLLMPSVKGVALRSMKAPGTAYDDPVLGKDPQPATMAGFVHTQEDNGGVHINSGIPNRAFYLAASAIGGHAWEKAGAIWYQTICDHALKQNASFKVFANRTVAHAAQLYGATSPERNAVTDAWREVGVKVGSNVA
jgi:Zn-dependent metalloprotease